MSEIENTYTDAGLVECVACEQCAFTFDKVHASGPGVTTCANCSEFRLEREVADLRATLAAEHKRREEAEKDRDAFAHASAGNEQAWAAAVSRAASAESALSRATADREEMAEVVRRLLASAVPNSVEHPTMWAAWKFARAALAKMGGG